MVFLAATVIGSSILLGKKLGALFRTQGFDTGPCAALRLFHKSLVWA